MEAQIRSYFLTGHSSDVPHSNALDYMGQPRLSLSFPPPVSIVRARRFGYANRGQIIFPHDHTAARCEMVTMCMGHTWALEPRIGGGADHDSTVLAERARGRKLLID